MGIVVEIWLAATYFAIVFVFESIRQSILEISHKAKLNVR